MGSFSLHLNKVGGLKIFVLKHEHTPVSIESFRTMCLEPQSAIDKNELLRNLSSEIELRLEEGWAPFLSVE